MSGIKGTDIDDQDAADAANQEILVLDRLVYRNRSQHRTAKYFTLALEVRRACRILAAPRVPELLAKCMGILARVPDSRNGRAREAWIRSAAAALQRMRAAAVACVEVLEATVQASRHLAHQVSQTYFMALSVVFLACLARLFVCTLHLGGRLIEVHGALLRTLLAQPSTSECLPAAALAACRIPEETATFLSRMRGAARPTKLREVKAPGRAEAAAASASAFPREVLGATAVGSPSMSAPIPAAGNTGDKDDSMVEGRREVGVASSGLVTGAGDDGDDSDDTGVRIGRAVAADQVNNKPSAGKMVRTKGAVTVEQDGKQGNTERDAGLAEGETEWGGWSGGGGTARDGERRVNPPRKVVLANEYSDSSDNDSDNSTAKPGHQQGRKQSLKSAEATSTIAAEDSRSGPTPVPRPSLPPPPGSFSAVKPPHPQPNPIPSKTITTAPASPAGGSDCSGFFAVGRAASTSPEEVSVPPGEHVEWMIDRGPALAYTPPQCTKGREEDAFPASSSPLEVATAAIPSEAPYPHGGDYSPRIPGAQRDVTDGVTEGTRGSIDGLTIGVKVSSKDRPVENEARAADATSSIPETTSRETAGDGGYVTEGRAIFCVTDVEASPATPGVGGVAGGPSTPLVDFFGSSSSAVKEISRYSSATGEMRRRKKGRKGKQQATSKRKGPPSSVPNPSKSTPSAVDSDGGYDRKAAAPSPTDRTSGEAVNDCRSNVVRSSRGETVDGERIMLRAGGGMGKQTFGGIRSPEAVSLLPEPASKPDALTVRAAVDAAAATTVALPPAAPSQHTIDEKGVENVGGSSLPPTKLLQQRGRASRKERSDPSNSGVGNKHKGVGSGTKRRPTGEAWGEATNRKNKKTKKASKGVTKRPAGGQGSDRNAIDDIFGSFT